MLALNRALGHYLQTLCRRIVANVCLNCPVFSQGGPGTLSRSGVDPEARRRAKADAAEEARVRIPAHRFIITGLPPLLFAFGNLLDI